MFLASIGGSIDRLRRSETYCRRELVFFHFRSSFFTPMLRGDTRDRNRLPLRGGRIFLHPTPPTLGVAFWLVPTSKRGWVRVYVYMAGKNSVKMCSAHLSCPSVPRS